MRGRHGLRAIGHFLGFKHHVFLASLTGHLKHGPDRRRSHRPAGLIFPAFRRYETRWKFSYRNSTPRSAASAGSADVVAAARSRDPVLAKIRLMWVLIVWLLRYKRPAISGLVSPRAMRPRISTSRWVRPSGGAGRGGSGVAGARVAASSVSWTRGSKTVRPPAAACRARAMSVRSASLVR